VFRRGRQRLPAAIPRGETRNSAGDDVENSIPVEWTEEIIPEPASAAPYATNRSSRNSNRALRTLYMNTPAGTAVKTAMKKK
jgi:hypothetical protein